MPAPRRAGKQTIRFARPPVILSAASVVGPKEGQGPLAADFDVVKPDTLLGEQSWEHAESHLLIEAAQTAIKKCGLTYLDLDLMLAGDLLNQITASSFAAREIDAPFLGLYGACSTMTESLALAAAFVDGGYAGRVLACASSHHDSAERQYRYPTEFGAQRVPTAQWTVTGAGAAIVAPEGAGPVITHATIGRVVDLGIKDSNDMGSAMAPAAAQTILQHFEDTGFGAERYDLVATGDLAEVGQSIAALLLKEGGLDLSGRYTDCGLLIYDREAQDVQAGGSGCGCSAVVFCGHFVRRMLAGELGRILLVATGALLSPTTYQQGDSIPCIAHAVAIEGPGAGQ
jgi:stage V sporulation protein AD